MRFSFTLFLNEDEHWKESLKLGILIGVFFSDKSTNESNSADQLGEDDEVQQESWFGKKKKDFDK